MSFISKVDSKYKRKLLMALEILSKNEINSAKPTIKSPNINYIKPSFKEFWEEAQNEQGDFWGSHYQQKHYEKELKKIAKNIYDKGEIKTLTKNQVDLAGEGKIPPKEWLLDENLAPEDDEKYRFNKDHFDDLIPALFNGTPVSMPVCCDGFVLWGRHRCAYALALEGKCKCFNVSVDEWNDLVKPIVEQHNKKHKEGSEIAEELAKKLTDTYRVIYSYPEIIVELGENYKLNVVNAILNGFKNEYPKFKFRTCNKTNTWMNKVGNIYYIAGGGKLKEEDNV